MLVVPEEKLGIMILTNSDSHSGGPPILYYILDNYLSGSSRDWNAIMLKQYRTQTAAAEAREKQRAASRNAETSPSRPLGDYAGTYADSLWGEVKVTVEGNRLVAAGPGAAGGTMEHWQYDTFRLTWSDPAFGKNDVTFSLDRDGKPVSLRIDSQQEPMIFKRR